MYSSGGPSVETAGGIFVPIARRNAILPLKQTRTFHVASEDQTRLVIRVYEGEQQYVKKNNLLAGFEVANLPVPTDLDSPAHEVDVTVEVDGNHHAKVYATHTLSNRNIGFELSDDVLLYDWSTQFVGEGFGTLNLVENTVNRQGVNSPSTSPSRTRSAPDSPDYVTAALAVRQYFEHRDTARAQPQQQPLSTSASSARVHPGTTSDARAPVVEDTRSQSTNVPTPSNSTVTTSASNIPKLPRPLTAPSELNVSTSASDIPMRPKPSTTPSEPTATTSASDILKYPKPGTLSLESASTTFVSDMPHDIKPVTPSYELPVILSAPDIPKNPTIEISPPESTGTFVSNVPTHPGLGSLGPEATLTYLAPDETTDSNGYAIPSHLSEVCGLEGRSIHSLKGSEAAEIGSKLHAVRSYLCSSKYARQSEFICSIWEAACQIRPSIQLLSSCSRIFVRSQGRSLPLCTLSM